MLLSNALYGFRVAPPRMWRGTSRREEASWSSSSSPSSSERASFELCAGNCKVIRKSVLLLTQLGRIFTWCVFRSITTSRFGNCNIYPHHTSAPATIIILQLLKCCKSWLELTWKKCAQKSTTNFCSPRILNWEAPQKNKHIVNAKIIVLEF